MKPLAFAIPGDPETPTGGYRYDARIAAGLADHGWAARPLRLGDDFPFPSADSLAAAARAFAAIEDGMPALVDGLAFGAMPALAAEVAARTPLVALVHHPLHLESGLDEATRTRLRASESAALANARGAIVTSARTARDVAELGMDPARIRIVEPGTDPAPVARGSAPEEPFAFLSVGAATPRKGHDVLIAAAAHLARAENGDARPWQIHIVGALDRDPVHAAALGAAISGQGLSGRVLLHGALDDDALDRLLDGADSFVAASRHEGYGMAVAEALARGLPLVVAKAGALSSTAPKTASLRVEADDPAALAAALSALLSDEGLRQRLARGARAAREALPRWDQQSARFAAALSDLLS